MTSSKVVYNHIPVQQSTFKAGLSARVHRWFRLTPSFGPDLVREMLTELGCASDSVVLDPFAGAGTTLIECQLLGIRSFGFEINPFLHFVCDTSLNWDLSCADLAEGFDRIESSYHALASRVSFETLESHGLEIPPIHNPTRWWKPDVLVRLLVLKRAIDELELEGTRSFFRLALAGVLVPDLSNVTLGRLQLHFIERSDPIDVWGVFALHAKSMIEDMGSIAEANLTRSSQAFHCDATAPHVAIAPASIDAVITSPPYPNRYSYVWNTRPHLYLLDHIQQAKQASAIDMKAIGGTWGTATSALGKGRLSAIYPAIDTVCGPTIDQIREHDNLMANYVTKYFNLLAKQIVAMDPLLAPNAQAAYVVGCSRIKGVFVETDVLLGHLFEQLGLNYTVSKVERIRRRHSGKDLHESIVYAKKT